MKKGFNYFALVLCCLFMNALSSNAQVLVTNDTDCDFKIRITWDTTNNCDPSTTTVHTVNAGETLSLPTPTSVSSILTVRGRYIGSSCPFRVGQPCNGGNLLDQVSCGSPCDDYFVFLSPDGTTLLLSN